MRHSVLGLRVSTKKSSRQYAFQREQRRRPVHGRSTPWRGTWPDCVCATEHSLLGCTGFLKTPWPISPIWRVVKSFKRQRKVNVSSRRSLSDVPISACNTARFLAVGCGSVCGIPLSTVAVLLNDHAVSAVVQRHNTYEALRAPTRGYVAF